MADPRLERARGDHLQTWVDRTEIGRVGQRALELGWLLELGKFNVPRRTIRARPDPLNWWPAQRAADEHLSARLQLVIDTAAGSALFGAEERYPTPADEDLGSFHPDMSTPIVDTDPSGRARRRRSTIDLFRIVAGQPRDHWAALYFGGPMLSPKSAGGGPTSAGGAPGLTTTVPTTVFTLGPKTVAIGGTFGVGLQRPKLKPGAAGLSPVGQPPIAAPAGSTTREGGWITDGRHAGKLQDLLTFDEAQQVAVSEDGLPICPPQIRDKTWFTSGGELQGSLDVLDYPMPRPEEEKGPWIGGWLVYDPDRHRMYPVFRAPEGQTTPAEPPHPKAGDDPVPGPEEPPVIPIPGGNRSRPETGEWPIPSDPIVDEGEIDQDDRRPQPRDQKRDQERNLRGPANPVVPQHQDPEVHPVGSHQDPSTLSMAGSPPVSDDTQPAQRVGRVLPCCLSDRWPPVNQRDGAPIESPEIPCPEADRLRKRIERRLLDLEAARQQLEEARNARRDGHARDKGYGSHSELVEALEAARETALRVDQQIVELEESLSEIERSRVQLGHSKFLPAVADARRSAKKALREAEQLSPSLWRDWDKINRDLNGEEGVNELAERGVSGKRRTIRILEKRIQGLEDKLRAALEKCRLKWEKKHGPKKDPISGGKYPKICEMEVGEHAQSLWDHQPARPPHVAVMPDGTTVARPGIDAYEEVADGIVKISGEPWPVTPGMRARVESAVSRGNAGELALSLLRGERLTPSQTVQAEREVLGALTSWRPYRRSTGERLSLVERKLNAVASVVDAALIGGRNDAYGGNLAIVNVNDRNIPPLTSTVGQSLRNPHGNVEDVPAIRLLADVTTERGSIRSTTLTGPAVHVSAEAIGLGAQITDQRTMLAVDHTTRGSATFEGRLVEAGDLRVDQTESLSLRARSAVPGSDPDTDEHQIYVRGGEPRFRYDDGTSVVERRMGVLGAHAGPAADGAAGEALVTDGSATLSFAAPAPAAHAASHQHGGADEVATATPGGNAIPKAGASGLLDAGWLPAATEVAQGALEIATAAEVAAGTDNTRAVTPDGLAGRYVRDEVSAPGTPGAGLIHEWIESDGKARVKTSDGVERRVGNDVGPWGSGSDGGLTVAGATVLADADKQYGDVTVSSGATWAPSGTGYVREHHFHRLVINGTGKIDLTGAGQASVAGATGGEVAGAGGSSPAAAPVLLIAATGGGGGGGGSTSFAGGPGGGGLDRSAPLLDSAGSGAGGAGGEPQLAGSDGTAVTALAAPYTRLRDGREIASAAFWGYGAAGGSGAAGGGGGIGSSKTGGDGGASGAGGGGYTIFAGQLVLSATAQILADGDAGVDGSAGVGAGAGGGGGGAGGAGGRIRIVCGECNTTVSAQTATQITMANGAIFRVSGGDASSGGSGGGAPGAVGGQGVSGEAGTLSFEVWGEAV